MAVVRTGERRFVLKALHEVGDQLLSEFYGFNEDKLIWRPAPEEFSLKETAAHLRDALELALAQMTAIIEGAGGKLPHWDVDVLPAERDYQGEDIYDLLRSCERLRRDVSYLFWGLDQGDWERAGRHPYRGSVTLGEIAKELAQHDLDHLWRVRKLKAALPGDRAAS